MTPRSTAHQYWCNAVWWYGDDTIDLSGATGATSKYVVMGDPDDDSILGSVGLDTISGGTGDDTITDGGVGGADSINGGAGDDSISEPTQQEVLI